VRCSQPDEPIEALYDLRTFAGLSNFVQSARDFRYLPAMEHIGLYLVIWLIALVVLVTGLALVLHQLPVRRLGGLIRFLYYIPGPWRGPRASWCG
jgi:multiple sugar transport system permease protein